MRGNNKGPVTLHCEEAVKTAWTLSNNPRLVGTLLVIGSYR